MGNERNTENLLRDKFRELQYYSNSNLIIDEQKTQNPTIQNCLKRASKKGGVGIGKPEFIIRSINEPDFVVVVECKADKSKHQSKTLDNYVDYAVDGVLCYASHLSTSFNVIAIAVSGETKSDLKISTYLWPKSATDFTELTDNKEREVSDIISFQDYIKYATYDPTLKSIRFKELISFSKDLHNYMRDHAKLSEGEKPLLVSGVLLALMDNAFSRNYKDYNQQKELPNEMYDAIKREISRAILPNAKKDSVLHPYSFICVHPEIAKLDNRSGETPLFRIIRDIETYVKPFITIYTDYDVIGQFYGEFLRYTGGDKKGLGIVLTPKHITESFAEMAELTPRSTVLDICAGTGGFLIASMNIMKNATKNDKEIKRIEADGLIGIEPRPNMFSLAVSNMMLRGDGKTNLYQGSCFDKAIMKKTNNLANIGMINPPYSQEGIGQHEFDFIYALLTSLKDGGKGFAIVPMGCAISPHPVREKILKEHRLDAVMSMPNDLFSPGTNIVTCVMVFTAHLPHEQNPKHKTWFGYWKDDGHTLTKHRGRIDTGSWEKIQATWLEMYFNRAELPGMCVSKKVSFDDEWCAEAYMETDYSKLTETDFETSIRDYVSFLFKEGI